MGVMEILSTLYVVSMVLCLSAVHSQLAVQNHPNPRRPGQPYYPRPKPPQYPPSTPDETSCLKYKETCSCNCNLGGNGEKRCEWKLVFKAVKGGGNDVFTDYTGGGAIGAPGANQLDNNLPFRDVIIDSWNTVNIEKVKLVLLDNNVDVARFVFDGVATDMQSWFSKGTLISSSYPNLKTTTTNFFSIPGMAALNRRFFINQIFGGCPNDCGFMAVVQGNTCAWENLEATPYFIYGGDPNSCTIWQNAQNGAKVADKLAIFIKLCKEDW